ncbi:cofilin [Psilocybe cubensis]|uniref:Cofilin n=1 Tax=Psilocybe cubensis TaxID=181762 RepID=A0ACB8GZ24_PSICU|nr:cofilin [Psilocybe cubensis]KAH9480826.1 cofilin [Psilocybe cubensis]
MHSKQLSFGIIYLTILIVHFSYAHRIYCVSKRKAIPTIMVVLALSNFGLGWILVAEFFRDPSLSPVPSLSVASGVGVNDSCLSTFQDLKLKKKFKYIIFNLSKDLSEIIVEKTSEDSDYDVFLADLPETECRWAIYDFEFEKEGAGKRNKIIFISWSPDDAKVKQKMVFASSRDALKRSLNGIAVEIQGTDFGEVAFESVLDKANRGN